MWAVIHTDPGDPAGWCETYRLLSKYKSNLISRETFWEIRRPINKPFSEVGAALQITGAHRQNFHRFGSQIFNFQGVHKVSTNLHIKSFEICERFFIQILEWLGPIIWGYHIPVWTLVEVNQASISLVLRLEWLWSKYPLSVCTPPPWHITNITAKINASRS